MIEHVKRLPEHSDCPFTGDVFLVNFFTNSPADARTLWACALAARRAVLDYEVPDTLQSDGNSPKQTLVNGCSRWDR